MKNIYKEFTLLFILPLVLMSLSLAVIGTSHTTMNVHPTRVVKVKQDFTDMPIPCDSLCKDIKNLENIFL